MRPSRQVCLALAAALVGCAAAQGSAPATAPPPYGKACEPLLRDLDGAIAANPCGAYLCIDGKCSSCTSDAQCQEQLGSPQCLAQADSTVKRCGRYMPEITEPAEPPKNDAVLPAGP